MENPLRNAGGPPEDETSSPFQKRWRRRTARVKGFDLRDQWWRLLDALEANRTLRRALYATLVLVVLGGVTWTWAYPWWTRHKAISIARQWIAVGRFDYAAQTVKQALLDFPEHPEAWQLAAEVARRSKNPAQAVGYSRRAATLAPEIPELTLEWAQDALLAEQPDTAERALATLPAKVVAESSHAQRIAGEIARRRIQLTAARDHFEAALRLDGAVAIDEVPLGAILIYSGETAERQRGLSLLAKWSADPEWGALAARTLLGDALDHEDHPGMLKWARILRVHPRCSLADIPTCLRAISQTDEAHYAEVLAILEKKQAADPSQVALLVGWLNQISRAADAVRWVQTLSPSLTEKPPAVVVIAESFRQTSDWPGLTTWLAKGDWGHDVEFIRLAYGMLAARQLGNNARVEELWRTLQSDAQTAGVHALFAANTLYTWGWQDEALTLLWRAVDQPGVAYEALGTLARHYQAARDAEGQYRAFRRLRALRAQDPSIANNFAFFAALTGGDLIVAEKTARENHLRAPANLLYLCTYAFALTRQNRPAEAVAMLKPVAGEWQKFSGLAFAYGLALAANGQAAQARPLLVSLDLTTLTIQEENLVKAALN